MGCENDLAKFRLLYVIEATQSSFRRNIWKGGFKGRSYNQAWGRLEHSTRKLSRVEIAVYSFQSLGLSFQLPSESLPHCLMCVCSLYTCAATTCTRWLYRAGSNIGRCVCVSKCPVQCQHSKGEDAPIGLALYLWGAIFKFTGEYVIGQSGQVFSAPVQSTVATVESHTD